MAESLSLEKFTQDLADVIPDVDRETTGQYGDGLGSENEERQLELFLAHLRRTDDRYERVDREMTYPDSSGRCDLILPTGMAVEAKLIRYWRANDDPEPTMYGHVFSPFYQNTLLSDARRLHESAFGGQNGLLGLFFMLGVLTIRRQRRRFRIDIRRLTLPKKSFGTSITGTGSRRTCAESPSSTASSTPSTDGAQPSRGLSNEFPSPTY